MITWDKLQTMISWVEAELSALIITGSSGGNTGLPLTDNQKKRASSVAAQAAAAAAGGGKGSKGNPGHPSGWPAGCPGGAPGLPGDPTANQAKSKGCHQEDRLLEEGIVSVSVTA